MSGIAGLLRFDGQEASRNELERVANALRAHGPDRSQVTVSGSVGLVHVLMRMTSEDTSDPQPWRGASGALITADLRLDNRNDLLARLGLTPHDAISWSDARIVLAAWERFGDAVWPMLRGPFAVAIWSPSQRRLTLARDPVGLHVVMWHSSPRFFAFATMPNGLFAFDGVRRELSEEKFADFLVLNHAEHATTIYKDIFRIAPAHVMHVAADGAITQHRYWSPDDIKPVRLASDQDYADGLRECLDTAVRRQMRSAHPVGCLLSGGLDSSSVAVLAARALSEKNQRLAAFTGVPRRGFDVPVPAGHYADETPYVDAIARAAGNIDVTYVANDAEDDLADLERFFVALEGPVRNPTNLAWVLSILRLARKQGRRVLLGGLRGNSTISWSGWSQTTTHAMHGRWLTALRQWRHYYRRMPHSRWRTTRDLLIEPILPDWVGDRLERRRQPDRVAPWQKHSPILPEFAATTGVDRRAKRSGHDFLYRMRADERIRALFSVDYDGDWHAAEKACTGVEVRDPTADLDVISYCFGVPPEQYLAEGTDRSLIRRAMWGLVPEAVLTNRLHGLQAPDWHERLAPRRDAIAREIGELSQSPLARRAIDLARLERAVKNWPSGGWHTPEIFTEYNLALMRGVSGGRFLRWFESAN
jgi:asparagine synthase (glutamine-hydrolysing)